MNVSRCACNVSWFWGGSFGEARSSLDVAGQTSDGKRESDCHSSGKN